MAALLAAGAASAQEAPLEVHAAGSLRGAFVELAQAFQKAGGAPVKASFGPSGLLKDRLAASSGPGLFASANMEHPQALAAAVLQWLQDAPRTAALQQRFTQLHEDLRRDTARLATDAIAQIIHAA